MSPTPRRGCVYCGFPRARARTSSGKLVTIPACSGHDDLLALDPMYELAGAIAAEAYPALDLDARAPTALLVTRVAPAFAVPP